MSDPLSRPRLVLPFQLVLSLSSFFGTDYANRISPRIVDPASDL